MDDLKKLIREVPDYPKPGILFYDLTTLLKDKQGFHKLIDSLCDHYRGHQIDVVAGIEARGFIFAPALAYRLGAGFVPVRKPKKLPAKTASISYALEYGTDTLEIHEDAVKPGQRVIICDDLLATGGTAAATANSSKNSAAKSKALPSPSNSHSSKAAPNSTASTSFLSSSTTANGIPNTLRRLAPVGAALRAAGGRLRAGQLNFRPHRFPTLFLCR